MFSIQTIADGNADNAIPSEIIQILACINPTSEPRLSTTSSLRKSGTHNKFYHIVFVVNLKAQKALLEIEGIDKESVHITVVNYSCRRMLTD